MNSHASPGVTCARRLSDGGGWRAFTEDEEVRAAAAVLAAR
ncbi:hypothetical protein [Micromonospora sp. NPDC050200]